MRGDVHVAAPSRVPHSVQSLRVGGVLVVQVVLDSVVSRGGLAGP